MKKVFLLAFFAMAALFSQALAECNVGTNNTTSCCWWSATSCWGIGGDYDDMKTAAQCTQNSGYPQSNCNAPSLEMCLWNAAGDCYPVPSQDGKTVADCERDGWHFSGGTGGEGTFCSGGTFVRGKTNTPPAPGGNTTPLGCCKWDDGSGKCWNIYENQEVTDCSGGTNQFWSGACPDQQGNCPSGPPSSILGVSTANLTVLFAAGSLHISSPKAASVLLFDMQGKQVANKMASAGYSIVAFENQRQGVYYAVVTSGSSKQTVRIVLK
jgi:hypothetical protein